MNNQTKVGRGDASIPQQFKIGAHAFNEQETEILKEVHELMITEGGPVNESRFSKIVNLLSPVELSPEMVELLFVACDEDKDGKISDNEWLTLLSLLFRIPSLEIFKVYDFASSNIEKKGMMKPINEDDCGDVGGFKEFDLTPRTSNLTDSSIESCKIETAKKKKKPKSVFSKVPPHPFQVSYCLAEHDLKLSDLKKSAIIKMNQAIPNKALVRNLWGTVCNQPTLMTAWTNNTLPSAVLIKASKAIERVNAMAMGQYGPKLPRNDPNYILMDKYERMSRGDLYRTPTCKKII